jgi:hypothetical protein
LQLLRAAVDELRDTLAVEEGVVKRDRQVQEHDALRH